MADAPFLTQPFVRSELMLYLSELGADDPRILWSAERESGMASGVDQVFHFLFDDHDFDSGAIGFTLFNEREVQLVNAVKEALEATLSEVGDAGDNDFTSHVLWPRVRRAAALATSEMSGS